MIDILLIITESTDTAELLIQHLSKRHEYVFVATNGMAAVQFTRSCMPILFILQDCPPEIHALQLAGHLHASTEFAAIPVIIIGVSAENQPDEIVTGNLVTFVDPFDLSVFLSTVEERMPRPLPGAKLWPESGPDRRRQSLDPDGLPNR